MVAARPRCGAAPKDAGVSASGGRSELVILTIPLRVMIDEHQLLPMRYSIRNDLVIVSLFLCLSVFSLQCSSTLIYFMLIIIFFAGECSAFCCEVCAGGCIHAQRSGLHLRQGKR